MQYHWLAAFEDGEFLRQFDSGRETSYGDVEKKAEKTPLVRLSLVPASPLHKGVFSVDLESGSFLAQGVWIPIKAPGKITGIFFRRRILELVKTHPRERTLYFLGWQCPQSGHQMALRIDPLRQLWCLTVDF